MFDYSWDDCIKRYTESVKRLEQSKSENPAWFEQTVAGKFNIIQLDSMMLLLVEQLKADSEIPELHRTISHSTLILKYPDVPLVHIEITPIEENLLYIGINQLEVVSVPLKLGTKTIKRFLKIIKDRCGHFEEGLQSYITNAKALRLLPLEWLHAAALEQIFERSLSYNSSDIENIPTMSQDNIKFLIMDLEKIKDIVMKTWEIAREKRTQEWLKELEKDND
jgi:hypothetical protein